MGNHCHLLIHTPRGNLGRGIRHLSGIFTQRFNRLEGRNGPLFRGRYRAIVVDADNYLLQVSRYIHPNPIVAQLVDRIDEYAWSSYAAYVGREAGPDWLCQNQVLGMVGGKDARKRYRAYVERGVDEAWRRVLRFTEKRTNLRFLAMKCFGSRYAAIYRQTRIIPRYQIDGTCIRFRASKPSCLCSPLRRQI
jgi:hypothetical protein